MIKAGALNTTFFEHAVKQYADKKGLSEREIDIFTLLTKGATSSEKIGKMLGVSRNTVRNHFQNIFNKTRTNSKPDLLTQFIAAIFSGAPAQNGDSRLQQTSHVLYIGADDKYADLAVRALDQANLGSNVVVVRSEADKLDYLRQQAFQHL